MLNWRVHGGGVRSGRHCGGLLAGQPHSTSGILMRYTLHGESVLWTFHSMRYCVLEICDQKRRIRIWGKGELVAGLELQYPDSDELGTCEYPFCRTNHYVRLCIYKYLSHVRRKYLNNSMPATSPCQIKLLSLYLISLSSLYDRSRRTIKAISCKRENFRAIL